MGIFSKAGIAGSLLSGGGGGLKDMLLGKKQDPFDPYKMMQLDPSLKKSVEAGREAQQKGLSALMADSGEEAARSQIAREQAGVGAATEDTARKIKESMAQRGMGRSSIGLGLEKGAQERGAQQKAGIMASLKERLRGMNKELIAAGGGVLGAQGAQRAMMMGKKKGRSGGLMSIAAPLAGAALGSAAGPQGAAAGMQAGSGLSSAMSNY